MGFGWLGSFVLNRSPDFLRNFGCDLMDVVRRMRMLSSLLQNFLLGITPCHEIAITDYVSAA